MNLALVKCPTAPFLFSPLVAVAVILAFAELLVWSFATLSAAAAFSLQSRAWRRDTTVHIPSIWLPALVELVGLVQFFWSPTYR